MVFCVCSSTHAFVADADQNLTLFEWKQQLVPDLHATPSISQKPSQSSKREDVKEKIILLQEKNIQRLNEIVRGLREQLQQCKSKNDTMQQTGGFLPEHFTEVGGLG